MQHLQLTLILGPHPVVCVFWRKPMAYQTRHDGLHRSTQVPVLQSEREREKMSGSCFRSSSHHGAAQMGHS